MSAQLFNFMAIEQSIVKRLEYVTQNDNAGLRAWCRKVGTAQYLAMLQNEGKQVTPALYVLYQGKTVLESVGTRNSSNYRWAVVLAVQNAADQKKTDNLNQMAGLYLAQVQAALLGFTPEGAINPLKEVTPPPPYYSSGFAFFPLFFETQVTVSSKWGSATGVASHTNRDVLTDKVSNY